PRRGPRGLPRLRGLRDRCRGRARRRPAPHRRPLHPRAGAARPAPPHYPRGPPPDRMDQHLGGAPMSRFTDAFGDWTPLAAVVARAGLLLDTEAVRQETEATLRAARGDVVQDGDADVLHGPTTQVAAELIAHRSGHSPEDVLADLHREFDAALATGIRTLPGAADILTLAAARVPLGCASNSWLASLEDKLTLGGLRERFTVLEASDTVERPKPAPDMYVAAARALGVAPEDCLALEDSGTGARAARDAGMKLI